MLRLFFKHLPFILFLSFMAGLTAGCASVRAEPTPEPTPTPRHFMIIPVKEQTFTNEAIRSWNFRRDILPITEGTNLEEYIDPELFDPSKADALDSFSSTCDFSDTDQPAIKGDIDNGKRIYYIPDDADYALVSIDESSGELWFCVEQSALDAGWRRPLM